MKEDDDLGDSVTQISLKALESQKRKQRNKKHKKKKPINNKSSEDNLEDDVEKSVREVNRILGKNESRRVGHVFSILSKITTVTHLVPNACCPRTFGPPQWVPYNWSLWTNSSQKIRSPGTDGPPKFGPHVQMVPNQFGHPKMVPK